MAVRVGGQGGLRLQPPPHLGHVPVPRREDEGVGHRLATPGVCDRTGAVGIVSSSLVVVVVGAWSGGSLTSRPRKVAPLSLLDDNAGSAGGQPVVRSSAERNARTLAAARGTGPDVFVRV